MKRGRAGGRKETNIYKEVKVLNVVALIYFICFQSNQDLKRKKRKKIEGSSRSGSEEIGTSGGRRSDSSAKPESRTDLGPRRPHWTWLQLQGC